MAQIDTISKAEAIKQQSRQLRGTLAKDLAGAAGMLAGPGPCGTADPTWSFGYLFAPALTIGGGTSEVQRNIIAERVLGLPHEIDVEADRSWTQARSAR